MLRARLCSLLCPARVFLLTRERFFDIINAKKERYDPAFLKLLPVEEKHMSASTRFIKATEEFNTFEQNVPSPYFRRAFTSDAKKSAKLTVAVCGLYELWFNGENITRGFFALIRFAIPLISLIAPVSLLT